MMPTEAQAKKRDDPSVIAGEDGGDEGSGDEPEQAAGFQSIVFQR